MFIGFLKALYRFLVVAILVQTAFVVSFYFRGLEIVQQQFENVARLVASDNCLDNTVLYNGKTNYERVEENIQLAEDHTFFLDFPSDALYVEYTSRDLAPQKNEPIMVRLKADISVQIIAFGTFRTHIPIEIEMPVTGTKFYRDR